MRLLPLLAFALATASPLAAAPAAAPALYSAEGLTAACTRDLAAHFNLEGDLQLEIIRPWTPDRPIAAGWTMNVLEYPTIPGSTMLVRCEVKDDAGSQVATLILHAALWRDAWAVHLPVEASSTFDVSRLETRRCDFLRERDVLPATEGDDSYMFARALPVGRLLTWRDITRHPLVKKGDLVEVTAADGLLHITMKVLALQSGVKGDTITVRNIESNKDFSVQITDRNHVQVQF
jgi:flagella basal body P-ring formation protein FlgA